MRNTFENPYDVVIVGGGVTGTALLYVLSKYTDATKLALFEKYGELAHVNSHYDANSQTLHFGDIETNYSFEKAKEVKEASSLLAAYAEKHVKEAILLSHKMVLAVGDEEVEKLNERFREIHELFPDLKRYEREQIAILEPKVIEGRDINEKVLALVSEKGYALNYQKVSLSFVKEAQKEPKEIDIFLKSPIENIETFGKLWRLKSADKDIFAKTVVFASGPHSLLFAKKLGFGKNLGILPVAGSFYNACGFLKGKVYTMQIKKLPFAAIHGDPNVNDPTETRFGPTAKVLPLLERHHWNTFADFLKTSVYTFSGIASLFKIISDKTIFFFVLRNLLYDLPLVGKHFFLKQAQKIIPTIKASDLEYGIGLGGIRPQVVDTEQKTLNLGEAKIIEQNVIFDITPSPGASVCLENARKNVNELKKFIPELHFDEERFLSEHQFQY
jgi:malate dehydrogenase (quinone)